MSLEKIIDLIHQENREEAVNLSIDLLKDNKITIQSLYEDVLRNALYKIDCKEGDVECIWREHRKTSIVRTIIELSYPYILNQKKKSNGKKVIILCPSEEYHEIGARMAHDFFLLQGYDSVYIGANTPIEVVKQAIKDVSPDYVAISATNYYHVIAVKKLIDSIKEVDSSIKVLVGGQAFMRKDALKSIQYDSFLSNYKSIEELD